jgi:hypothetical protein
LILSGRRGLIARHVVADPARACQPWILMPADIIQLIGTTLPSPSWIVLEQTDGTHLRLSRLEKLSGISSDQTEILLTLMPLTVIERGAMLTVREPTSARAWREELALDSGSFSLDGNWRWCSRPINIGATVLGGNR